MKMHLLTLLFAVLCVSLCRACRVVDRGVSEKDKKLIVDLHNQLRQKVASGQEGDLPKASNMKNLEWDDNLETKAQEWTETCKFFTQYRFRDENGNVDHHTIGQNTFRTWSHNITDLKPNWNDVIQSWYGEVSQFDPKTINGYVRNAAIKHFTQMIWADTDRIGCGYVTTEETEEFNQFFACDYLPPGNKRGQPIYEKA